MLTRITDNRGIVALMTVIIIGALLVMVGLVTAQLGHSQMAFTGETDKEQWARHYAVACLEEAVYRVRLSPVYVGSTVPIDGYSCSIVVTGTGIDRHVVTTATVGDYTKSVTADLVYQTVASGGVAWTIESWSETDPAP